MKKLKRFFLKFESSDIPHKHMEYFERNLRFHPSLTTILLNIVVRDEKHIEIYKKDKNFYKEYKRIYLEEGFEFFRMGEIYDKMQKSLLFVDSSEDIC